MPPLQPLSTSLLPPISKTALLRELSTFARPSNKMGLLLFARDYLLYWSFMGAVLFAPSMSLKAFASVLMGLRLTSFYTLAHDASHRTLVANRQLNWWLALLLGVPSFQNYRMWTHDHNMVHHPRTNGDHVDFYRPYSKGEFDKLSKFSQWMERVYRAPHAGISSYHSLEAQKHMNKLLGNRLVVEPMSLQGAIATMKACKL